MSVSFKENTKTLSLSVVGYEFQKNDSKDANEYDNNWLMIKVDYEEGELKESYIDASLLSWELDSISGDIYDVLKGKESGCFFEFIEPYLKMSLVEIGERYIIHVRFVYDTSDGIWRERYVVQELSKTDLIEIWKSFIEMSKKYPQR